MQQQQQLQHLSMQHQQMLLSSNDLLPSRGLMLPLSLYYSGDGVHMVRSFSPGI
jgi:hypothetical protein